MSAQELKDPELHEVLMELLQPITSLLPEAQSCWFASKIAMAYAEVLADLGRLMDDTYTEGYRDGRNEEG